MGNKNIKTDPQLDIEIKIVQTKDNMLPFKWFKYSFGRLNLLVTEIASPVRIRLAMTSGVGTAVPVQMRFAMAGAVFALFLGIFANIAPQAFAQVQTPNTIQTTPTQTPVPTQA